MFPLYFLLDSSVQINITSKIVCSRPGRPSIKISSIIYLHGFTKNERDYERFSRYLDPFVNLCHSRGHKPTSVLLVLTPWYDGGENVGTTEMYEKTLELGKQFQKAASYSVAAIHLISYSV